MIIHVSLSSQDDPPKDQKRGFVKYLHNQEDVLASAFKHLTEEGWFVSVFLKHGIHQITPS